MPAMPAEVVRILGPEPKRLGKAQQQFNRLSKKVATLKAALRTWTAALPEIHRLIGDHEQARLAHVATVADIVRTLDHAITSGKIGKRDAQFVREVACDAALDVLRDGGPEDLKAIYKRHTGHDYDDLAAAHEIYEVERMREVLEQELGLDFADDDAFVSIEELQAATRAKLEHLEREQAQQEARKPTRKKSGRAQAAADLKEVQRVQADKALQEIYRKLALALHPDHERDAAERARKTELMQAVNVAYERKDLLGLLELQLRFEQVDQARLDGLADAQLAHFNKLLGEQARQLEDELLGVTMPFRVQLDIPPPRKLEPAKVVAQLRRDIALAADELARARADLARFGDLPALRAWIAAERRAEQAW